MLVGVARRLQALLRGSDVVARLGGDEFVVVAAGLSGDADAQAIDRKLLDGFREPFVAAGGPAAPSASPSATRSRALDGRDANGLLQRADAAMARRQTEPAAVPDARPGHRRPFRRF